MRRGPLYNTGLNVKTDVETGCLVDSNHEVATLAGLLCGALGARLSPLPTDADGSAVKLESNHAGVELERRGSVT
jgi:hypothetical protein